MPHARPFHGRRMHLFWIVLCVGCVVIDARSQTRRVLQIDLHNTIQKEQAIVFQREMVRANAEHYDGILLNLSTPGGQPDAADQISDAIRRSRVPVIVWAGKPHTRIAGEGLRVLAEADVALLAPDTFLTPLWSPPPRTLTVQEQALGSRQLLSILNRAASMHARSTAINDNLASGIHWVDANEALRSGFVDGLAAKPADTLWLADGRTVARLGVQLHLNGAHIEPSFVQPQEKLLLMLMNPDLCILLLTLGFLLIYLEINTPGTVVPGAAGVLLVLLAAYALEMLPLSAVGIALCISAALLLLTEAQFPSFGIVAGVGILALIAGLGTLVKGPIPQLQVSWATAIGAGLGFGGVTAALIVLGMEARRSKFKTGAEALLGWMAIAQTALSPEGHILVRGELWRARLSSRDSFVAAGERVKVLRADGMTLEVTAVPIVATA